MHIGTRRVDLPITVHYLQVLSQNALHLLIPFQVLQSLVVNQTVHHLLRGKEATVNEQVSEECDSEKEELPASNFSHLLKLLLSPLLNVLLDLFASLIFISDLLAP